MEWHWCHWRGPGPVARAHSMAGGRQLAVPGGARLLPSERLTNKTLFTLGKQISDYAVDPCSGGGGWWASLGYPKERIYESQHCAFVAKGAVEFF